jgi:hypothetical protein
VYRINSLGTTRLTEWKYVRNVKVEEITVCREDWKESADKIRETGFPNYKIRVRIKRKIKETLKREFWGQYRL